MDRTKEQLADIAMELHRVRAVVAQLEQELSELRMEFEALKNRRCRHCGAAA